MTVTLRVATYEQDFTRIYELLDKHFWPEHQITGIQFPINYKKSISKVCQNFSEGRVLVAEKDGELVGSLALVPDSEWWSDTVYLTDGWFYVRPDARNSRAAIMLLDEAKKIAEQFKVPLVIKVANSVDIERKDAFFLRKGFIRAGCFYVKAV